MAQPTVPLASIDEQKSLSPQKQQEIKVCIPQVHSKSYPDLLNGSRKDYITTAIPLYEASIKGDWKSAKEILDKRPELVKYSLTENGETALHVAATAKSTKEAEDFVENLMTYMEKTDLELENYNCNTALCLAAAAGNVKMVKIMVEKNKALVAITGSRARTPPMYIADKCKGSGIITSSQGLPPLYMAALFGHYDVVKYLYEHSKLHDDCWTPQNRSCLLQKCVESDMFDIAIKIVKEFPELESSGAVLAALAQKTDAFNKKESNIIMRTINWVICPKKQALEERSKAKALELLTIIWQHIAEKPMNEIDDILRGPPDNPCKQHDEKLPSDREVQTLELLKLIHEGIDRMPLEIRSLIKEPPVGSRSDLNVNAKKKYPSRILFNAVERGNTRFVVELIRQYPDLVWKVNDDGQSIFHVAARHRQVDIYNLLHEIGSYKDLITQSEGKNKDNMLHLVAKRVDRKRLEDVSGGAFQMQRELLWFKEVEGTIPRAYRAYRNEDGLTPRDLFTNEHKDLVVKGEEWMKGTASQCMVVATLIATIVFAAAFTVPGGYSQDKGIPFFHQDTSFLIFVVADAISLFSSSASILTFLSILTSGYAENDFLKSLPRKLMLGVATLYLSITTMMIAFSVSFFVLYSKNLKWIPILVTLIATMPVLLFAVLQYRLLKDVISSTYGSRYIFRPKKRVLYPVNSCSNHRWFPFKIPFISRCTSKLLKLL